MAGLLGLGLLIGACRQDMQDQPRYEPFEGNPRFEDGRSDRPQVKGTVARGQLILDDLLYRGIENGEPATRFPFPVSAEVLERGRERYDIYCATCHDQAGTGRGMAVRRGLRPPPSLHEERLRDAPPGHLFDVISNGFGAMFDVADRVAPRDRWAIVGYVRALQASQNVPVDELSESVRARLEATR